MVVPEQGMRETNTDKEMPGQTSISQDISRSNPFPATDNTSFRRLPAMCNRIIVRNEGCEHEYIHKTEACTAAHRVGLCKKTQDKVRISPWWVCDGCLSALRRAVESMSNKSGMLNGYSY